MAVRWTSLASLTRRASPNYWDVIAFTMIVAVFVVIANGSRGMVAALPPPGATTVSLDYGNLPYYALRTSCACSRPSPPRSSSPSPMRRSPPRAGAPRWSSSPFSTCCSRCRCSVFSPSPLRSSLALFPGSVLGAECAAIFAIFTSQAWNMAFSLLPVAADRAARSRRGRAQASGSRAWQRFWRLEVPFAMPGPALEHDDVDVRAAGSSWSHPRRSPSATRPSSCRASAPISRSPSSSRRVDAVLRRSSPCSLSSSLYDQLLFRPLVAWAGKFRVELSAGADREEFLGRCASSSAPAGCASWRARRPTAYAVASGACELPAAIPTRHQAGLEPSRIVDVAWFACDCGWRRPGRPWKIVAFVSTELTWGDLLERSARPADHAARRRADRARDRCSGFPSAFGSACGRALPNVFSRWRSSSPPFPPTSCFPSPSSRSSAFSSTPISGSAR